MSSKQSGRFTTKRVVTTALSIAAIGGIVVGVSGAAGVDAASLHRRDRGQIACVQIERGSGRLDTVLSQLVTDGTITADQQVAIENKLSEAKAANDFDCSGKQLMRDRTIGNAVLELLGMDRIDFAQAWVDGQSLAEMAEAQGISREELVSTITTAIDARLTESVEKGKITEEQKAEILANVGERIETGIDSHIGDRLDRMEEKRDSQESSPSTPVSSSQETLVA